MPSTLTYSLNYSLTHSLSTSGKRVILMGDLNSLSPLDQELHREGNLADLIRTQPMASLPDLRRKLLNTTGSINYKPIQTLLDSGLQDSCAVSCARQAHVVTATESARAIGDDVTSEEEVSRCMRYMCSSSEPTLYNPEVILHHTKLLFHPTLARRYISLCHLYCLRTPRNFYLSIDDCVVLVCACISWSSGLVVCLSRRLGWISY